MDPRWLMPLLAVVFAVLAIHKARRAGLAHPAVRSWALMALIFAAVAVWLQRGASG